MWFSASISRTGEQLIRDELLTCAKKRIDAQKIHEDSNIGMSVPGDELICCAFLQGHCTRGAAWDMQCYVRPFDFALSEIRVPLRLFHGSEDRNVPLALVQATLRQLPGADLVVFAGDAHLSTLCGHINEILAAAV